LYNFDFFAKVSIKLCDKCYIHYLLIQIYFNSFYLMESFHMTAICQVMIVDDHPLIIQGLTILLNQNKSFDVIGTAQSCQDCMSKLIQLEENLQIPDVILLDIHLPDGNGFELTQKIKLKWPQRKILLMSAQDEDLCVGWGLKFGAEGMFNKSLEPSQIYPLLLKAMSGELALNKTSHYWGIQSMRGDFSQGIHQLTAREFSVFFQIGCGQNSKQIANHLGISVRTIETYHRNIREKLFISHHDALIRLATLIFSNHSTQQQVLVEQKLIHQFQQRSLSKQEWTHEAHLIVAFHYLSRYSYNQALSYIKEGIKKLNQAHGKLNAYHETITVAFAKLIHAHLSQAPIWIHSKAFFESFPYLNSKDALTPLLNYYSHDVIMSEAARKTFIEPDLNTLP
jgi:DNA-binding NarL/FixJ family response regulator